MNLPGARFACALAAAGLAGLLQAWSIAWPWNGQPQWWLQILSLAVLAGVLLREDCWRKGLLLGWAFATSWLAATFWWLFISMHFYGGLAAPLAAIAVLGLAAFLALYYAVGSAVFTHLRGAGPLRDATLFASLWLAGELLRVTWFTGFPWGAGGYAHVDGPLAFLAPWIGVHGMGWLAAWIACALALLAVPRPGSRGAMAGAALVGVLLLAGNGVGRIGPPESADAPALRVALLQGNIAQDEKFEDRSGVPQALEWYGRMLRSTDADLVVAPETALPLLPQQLPEGYFEALRATFADGSRAALVGLPLGSYSEGYTNSVVGMKPGDMAYRYDKHHLVPFGEFIPPLFKWFTRLMNIPLGDFNRGDLGQPSFSWRGERLAPNICYEDLFGEELGARFRDPATAPTIFVNLSNIGWFGNTVAIDQHLHISRMRALEFARPMIRATNTGATAIIDRFGRVTNMLGRHTRGVLVGDVVGGRTTTAYAWWVSRFGLWPLWLLALGVPLLAAVARRRRPPPYN
ncbi:MAG: lnt [Ramlibacter sp.]|uniref:apolipoprotein N-acyltransferase n=1 Tax=Ramlibacter sp. TaxID=1917967 RepID=UPI00262B3E35|nr:apolipoprotein N-acyltransferase [Ramlibacter sp.]MDB5749834.1 lnt [Ramlibacter sp.]